MLRPALSLIFQVDGELKKVAGGQKKSDAAAELAGGMLKLQLFVGCHTEANLCYNFNHFY